MLPRGAFWNITYNFYYLKFLLKSQNKRTTIKYFKPQERFFHYKGKTWILDVRIKDTIQITLNKGQNSLGDTCTS